MEREKVPPTASVNVLTAMENAQLAAVDAGVTRSMSMDILKESSTARLKEIAKAKIAQSRSTVMWKFGHFRRLLGHPRRVEYPVPVYTGPPSTPPVTVTQPEMTLFKDIVNDVLDLARAWAKHFESTAYA